MLVRSDALVSRVQSPLFSFSCHIIRSQDLILCAFQDGSLRNGDHLLAVGDVRLWGMGAEQVASILRQAGQDSIRLVVARPVDPSVPQFALNSTIVPTKVLTDPQGLDQALQSGLQQAANVNGYAFDPAANGAAYPEAYQVNRY